MSGHHYCVHCEDVIKRPKKEKIPIPAAFIDYYNNEFSYKNEILNEGNNIKSLHRWCRSGIYGKYSSANKKYSPPSPPPLSFLEIPDDYKNRKVVRKLNYDPFTNSRKIKRRKAQSTVLHFIIYSVSQSIYILLIHLN